MLNFTVYCKSSNKTIFPWRICAVNPPDVTFRRFYHKEMKEQPGVDSLVLDSTFVGRSKDSLDAVDSDLRVLDVTGMFGPFAKFCVKDLERLTLPSTTFGGELLLCVGVWVCGCTECNYTILIF